MALAPEFLSHCHEELAWRDKMEERYPENQVCMWSDIGKREEDSAVQLICPNLKGSFLPRAAVQGLAWHWEGRQDLK